MSPTATTSQRDLPWPDSMADPETTPATQWCEVTMVETEGWAESAFRRISEFAALPKNWDGYGSPPLAGSVVKVAIAVVRLLIRYEWVLPAAQLVPTSGGGIQFEWSAGERELEVEFLPDGAAEFLTSVHGEPVEEGELETVGGLLSRLLWLARR